MKLKIALLGTILIIVSAVFTNPEKEDHIQKVSNENLLNDLQTHQDYFSFSVQVSYLRNNAVYDDYLIFSICNYHHNSNSPNRTLGIFGNVLTFE